MSLQTLLAQPPPFDASSLHGIDTELPSYAQIRPPHRQATISSSQSTAHAYTLPDKSGHAWLTLRCTSRAARPEQVPRVLEGDSLAGSVEVSLLNWKTVKSARVTVRA